MDEKPDLSTLEARAAHLDILMAEALSEIKHHDLIRHRRKEDSWLKKVIASLKWVLTVIKEESWRLRK